MKRAHVYIFGKVQGVFYRANTKKQAKKRGLKGWVKNLKDGRVEAVFEGPEEKIREMIEWCRIGSSAARVEEVKVDWEEPEGLEKFAIKY